MGGGETIVIIRLRGVLGGSHLRNPDDGHDKQGVPAIGAGESTVEIMLFWDLGLSLERESRIGGSASGEQPSGMQTRTAPATGCSGNKAGRPSSPEVVCCVRPAVAHSHMCVGTGVRQSAVCRSCASVVLLSLRTGVLSQHMGMGRGKQ